MSLKFHRLSLKLVSSNVSIEIEDSTKSKKFEDIFVSWNIFCKIINTTTCTIFSIVFCVILFKIIDIEKIGINFEILREIFFDEFVWWILLDDFDVIIDEFDCEFDCWIFFQKSFCVKCLFFLNFFFLMSRNYSMTMSKNQIRKISKSEHFEIENCDIDS